MNCSDISLFLDDRDIGALDDGLRKAVDTHVAACPDCARDWKLHTRLVSRKLPALPTGLLNDCSALAISGPAASRSRRIWNRGALAAGVAVLVAAAATLMFYGAPGTGSAEVASASSAGTEAQDRSVLAGTSSPSSSQDVLRAQVNTPSAVPNAAPEPQAVGNNTFSVRLSTLQDDTLGGFDKSVFDIFRTAAIDKLRQTPGLILVLAESSTYGQTVDFEITLSAVRQNGKLRGRLDVSKSGPNPVVLPIRGALGQDCAPSCFQDAITLGESMAGLAAKMMMPSAAASKSALLQQLQDFSLAPQQRLEALQGLDSRNLGVRQGGLRTDPSGDSLRDPAVIRAVLELASVASSPEQRAEIWKTVRTIRSPALVEPLARAAQLDSDSTVRAEAVATLMADFVDDPRARAAFEQTATADSHPMVRALAQSGLSGEATWNSYILASLKDTTLSDAQRLDAVLFHARNSAASAQPLAGLLDDDAIKALALVLPRTEVPGTRTLLNHLVSIKHPAITGMLLASIERPDSRFDRRLVMQMLADRLSQPGVRAALEKIATADPDEQSRKFAAQALKDDE
ncbi:MAG: HEAT repeat domain-containing protein [Steroidobacteraceae bacterium]